MTQTPLSVAQTFSGTREGDALLDKFLNAGGKGLSATQYAWCSRFIQRAAQQAGYDVGKATDMARSWLNVGTKVDRPEPGDVAVFPRGSNPALGHVGYVQSVNPDGTVSLLSGNSGDAVNTRKYPMSAALGFRRLSYLGGPQGESDPRNVAMNSGSAGVRPTGTAGYSGPIHTKTPNLPPQPGQPPTADFYPTGHDAHTAQTQWAKGMHQQMLTNTPALPGSLDAPAPTDKNSPQYKNILMDLLGGIF